MMSFLLIYLTFNQYSRSYYRATWILTGLDAGHATAMNIQPKWLRDIAAVAFSLYYVIYANEADEKVISSTHMTCHAYMCSSDLAA
jgi:hypothetical protein